MLWTIARHELRQLGRDGRLRAAAWLGLGLLVALAFLGWQTYRREAHERAHFEASARTQWENQGEKHPHRAAHFGLYLTKPELPLALFDSGIKPATGRVLWLEAHSRSVFAYSPVEDAGATGILGLTNGAEVLQLLGALLVILAAYGSVAREREDGTLRLIFAQGVSPLRWFAGKCAGLATALGLVGLPIAAGLWLLCWRADPAAFTADAAARALALVAAHALFFQRGSSGRWRFRRGQKPRAAPWHCSSDCGSRAACSPRASLQAWLRCWRRCPPLRSSRRRTRTISRTASTANPAGPRSSRNSKKTLSRATA